MKEFNSIEEAQKELKDSQIKNIKMRKRSKDGKLYLTKIFVEIEGEDYVVCNTRLNADYPERLKLIKESKLPGE